MLCGEIEVQAWLHGVVCKLTWPVISPENVIVRT